ncbi:GDP-mannose 4,6-dehydratase, partial [Candidatus Bathyarchaeota archaeon]|nr:GDP-mannose 4,6-dehydratase [Candidatus Bathyarchaeota archaeon]
VDRLLSDGHEVKVIDDLSYGLMKNLIHHKSNKDLHFIKGDIRNLEDVKEAVEDVDAVFHEAGLVGIVVSVKNPLLTHEVNVTGTLNLLKASSELGVKRFIFASSAAVYGNPSKPRKKEDMPLDATGSPYAASKLAAENYVSVFNNLYGLETVSLRYFNIYGPRQRFDISSVYGSVILLFLNRLLKNIPPMIFGDGEQKRDFVYIQDVVEANMLALHSKNSTGQVFNIGTGIDVSVNEVSRILKELMNKTDVQDIHAAPRPPDVRRGFADIQKASRLIGYKPKYSIKEGITDLIKQYPSRQERP